MHTEAGSWKCSRNKRGTFGFLRKVDLTFFIFFVLKCSNFQFLTWECNLRYKYVLRPNEDGKGFTDRLFLFTSTLDINAALKAYVDYKLGNIPSFKDMKNKDVVLRKCHHVMFPPRWLDALWDPKRPHIRHLYFRLKWCGRCEFCLMWPPKVFDCTNMDTCGEWFVVEVDTSYQNIFQSSIFLILVL